MNKGRLIRTCNRWLSKYCCYSLVVCARWSLGTRLHVIVGLGGVSVLGYMSSLVSVESRCRWIILTQLHVNVGLGGVTVAHTDSLLVSVESRWSYWLSYKSSLVSVESRWLILTQLHGGSYRLACYISLLVIASHCQSLLVLADHTDSLACYLSLSVICWSPLAHLQYHPVNMEA
jgi:hypothetical protein